MSEKKHKSGYDLLKEKLAKAEDKNAELQKEKEILVQTAQDNYCRVEKERDEWKSNCEHYKQESEYFHGQFRNELDIGTGKDKRIAFLLYHCGPICRWLYRRHFEKGGKK